MPLRNVPLGSTVHCVEMRPGKGAQIARSAGAAVQLIAKEGAHATLRLRSGEMRKCWRIAVQPSVKCVIQNMPSCAG